MRQDSALRRVPTRDAVGHDLSGSAPAFLLRLFRSVLPVARTQLASWVRRAQEIPDAALREQALASLRHKRFHADGGCVYAAASGQHAHALVRLIIAYQTMSDYLDNLCDRCDTYDMADFHQLHHAMRDAVRPSATSNDYYALRGSLDDGGYLQELVTTCQEEVRRLPGYDTIAPKLEWFAERYCELQEYKHIQPDQRQDKLRAWWSEYESEFPDLDWWEFAAATGSTLGIFALFLAATESLSVGEVEDLTNGYFPWICGLHILLDYYIDLEEDRVEGDFNFVQCYESIPRALERVQEFAKRGLRQAAWISGRRLRSIHRYVVQGLIAMYLSDRKVRSIRYLRPARRLVRQFGPTVWMFYMACQVYRRVR